MGKYRVVQHNNVFVLLSRDGDPWIYFPDYKSASVFAFWLNDGPEKETVLV